MANDLGNLRLVGHEGADVGPHIVVPIVSQGDVVVGGHEEEGAIDRNVDLVVSAVVDGLRVSFGADLGPSTEGGAHEGAEVSIRGQIVGQIVVVLLAQPLDGSELRNEEGH